MHVHAVGFAVLPPCASSPWSVRWPEPPVPPLGREHALGKSHDARIAAFQRLSQQYHLMLALDATAHPSRHLGEFINNVEADREAVRRQQAACVKNQIECRLNILDALERFYAERETVSDGFK